MTKEGGGWGFVGDLPFLDQVQVVLHLLDPVGINIYHTKTDSTISLTYPKAQIMALAEYMRECAAALERSAREHHETAT